MTRPEPNPSPGRRPEKRERTGSDWPATVGVVLSLALILGFILLMVKL